MKKLINKLVHACGLYTAADVEYIEKQWRKKLDQATTADIKIVAAGAGGGGVDMRGSGGNGGPCWGMPENNWTYFQSDL